MNSSFFSKPEIGESSPKTLDEMYEKLKNLVQESRFYDQDISAKKSKIMFRWIELTGNTGKKLTKNAWAEEEKNLKNDIQQLIDTTQQKKEELQLLEEQKNREKQKQKLKEEKLKEEKRLRKKEKQLEEEHERARRINKLHDCLSGDFFIPQKVQQQNVLPIQVQQQLGHPNMGQNLLPQQPQPLNQPEIREQNQPQQQMQLNINQQEQIQPNNQPNVAPNNPSWLSSQYSKYKRWIWGGVAAVGTALGYYFWNKQGAKKPV